MALPKGIKVLKWRYLDNLVPSLSYRLSRPAHSPEVIRVLQELNQNGVGTTTVQGLLGTPPLFEELKTAVEELERQWGDRIVSARIDANKPQGWKHYLLQLLDNRPILDPNDVYVRFALQKPILDIANAYFGMYTRLRFYNVWHVVPTQLNPQYSQLWHRDPEDHFILKLFVHLSDIDDGAGPFIYAAGSHPKKSSHREPSFTSTTTDRAKRSDDGQMAEVLPPERWIKGVGPTGTMIFADTRGYHKGGLARERERLQYVCMFTSQATKYPESFARTGGQFPVVLDAAQAFALNIRGPSKRPGAGWRHSGKRP